MTFKELNIIKPITEAIQEKGYSIPTPIQQKAIPQILSGKDILGLAQTGSGKTAAFSIPIIQELFNQENKISNKYIKALIITPTRELAIQIGECFTDYAKYTELKHCVIFGGVKQKPQTDELNKGVDILIATPGRLLDLMSQGFIKLDSISHFVLDEADRMLDMGFINDIKRLLLILPKNKQTLLFSATMPAAIVNFSNSILKNPIKIEASPTLTTTNAIKQNVYFVEKQDKKNLLIDLLNNKTQHSVLVFTKTKHGADKISRLLLKTGITSESIHGNKSQIARQRSLTNFKSKKTRILIATDIAARGIDIDKLDLVINYDLPDIPETYVHRIGRTGRAGNTGIALSFCSSDERNLLKDIQKLTGYVLPAIKHTSQSTIV